MSHRAFGNDASENREMRPERSTVVRHEKDKYAADWSEKSQTCAAAH